MLKYLVRRISATLVVLTLISMSVFLIFDVLPMDPARLTCGKACSPAVVEANRHRLGNRGLSGFTASHNFYRNQ